MKARVTKVFIDREGMLHLPGQQIDGDVEYIKAVVEADKAVTDEPIVEAKAEKPPVTKKSTKKEK